MPDSKLHVLVNLTSSNRIT